MRQDTTTSDSVVWQRELTVLAVETFNFVYISEIEKQSNPILIASSSVIQPWPLVVRHAN